MGTEIVSAARYDLEIQIAAPIERVWETLATESSKWWPADFVTSERTQRFVIEAKLGGRVFEDFGDGSGLIWYSVIGMDVGRELILAGHLLPPYGGPAMTALRITLVSNSEGTLVHIRDDRLGILGGEPPTSGWLAVFDSGLRAYVEQSAVQ